MTHSHEPKKITPLLCLTALGVVYGDIGTSPLYAIRECFWGAHAVEVSPENVLGVLSLIVWTLLVVVSVKYVLYVLRADHNGEGGILALTWLTRSAKAAPWARRTALGLGLFGAALLYGDAMLTPAISVLSAVEGLEVATPLFEPYVIPITITLLIGLFMLQRKGTTGVGIVFGPVIALWLVVLAVSGAAQIARAPQVFAALNPYYGWAYLMHNGTAGLLSLGAVFLVATGAEAMYADLGHFSAGSIRVDWFSFVLPALVLNYFGQGALLLVDPSAADNPFYRMVPSWSLYPAVVLATSATIIASQAVISGVFSLTRQAVLLGYLPRTHIVHTSSREVGQIYIPALNWMLLLATTLLVVGFQRSTNLAAAYGIAISVTMVITTLLAHILARGLWNWPLVPTVLMTLFFLAADLAFLGANSAKILAGGWVPLVIAAAVVIVFGTWKRGRAALNVSEAEGAFPLEQFAEEAALGKAVRVPGTAVFLTGDPQGTPSALLHNVKHNKVIHEQNYLVTVLTEDVPRVTGPRVSVQAVGPDFHRVQVRYGYMEDPNIPAALEPLRLQNHPLEPMKTTYFLSVNTLVHGSGGRLAPWRHWLFSLLHRNAERPSEFFRLPHNRVVEIGRQIQL